MNNRSNPGQESETSAQGAPKQLTRETESGITYFEATPEQVNSSRLLQDVPAHTTLLSGPQVAQRLGIDFNDLISMYAEDEFQFIPGFPDPAEFVPGMCRWLEHEVDHYIERRIFHRSPRLALKVTDWQKFSDAVR